MESIQQIIASSSDINLIDNSVVNLIFSYLFFGGYLTITNDKQFIIPNYEVE